MHFDLFVSNDSVAISDVHRKTTFFRGASGDLLSLAQFSIFSNENVDKYFSNVALLYGNWPNELTLSVSPKNPLKTFDSNKFLFDSKILCLNQTNFI